MVCERRNGLQEYSRRISLEMFTGDLETGKEGQADLVWWTAISNGKHWNNQLIDPEGNQIPTVCIENQP